MPSITALRARVTGWSLHAFDSLSAAVAARIAAGIDGLARHAAGAAARVAGWLRPRLAAWRESFGLAALRERLLVSPAMLLVEGLRARLAGAAAAVLARWQRLAAGWRQMVARL